VTAEGQNLVPRAQPVPAAPPRMADVVRHGASVGLGAFSLARRAAGTALGRMHPAAQPPQPPSTADLVPGAIAGVAIIVERRVRILVSALVSGAAGAARAASQPAIVQRALRPIEDRIWSLNEVARREQARNRAEAAALIPLIVQQVTENVVAQIDFVRVVEQVPIEEIVEHLDVEAIVARIDLGGVIRESTATMTTEVVDALRDQGMALDGFSARVVDRLLFRRRPRQLDVRAS
jgi:hypothetical protein